MKQSQNHITILGCVLTIQSKCTCMREKMDIKERAFCRLSYSSFAQAIQRGQSKTQSNFESYHRGPGYLRKRHFESVESGLGLSWRMPSIMGTAAAAGGKQPWLVIKATTHLRVLRLISCWRGPVWQGQVAYWRRLALHNLRHVGLQWINLIISGE